MSVAIRGDFVQSGNYNSMRSGDAKSHRANGGSLVNFVLEVREFLQPQNISEVSPKSSPKCSGSSSSLNGGYFRRRGDMTKYENKTLNNSTIVLEECFFLNCVLTDCSTR